VLFLKTFTVFLFSSNPLNIFIHHRERGGQLQTLLQSYQNVSNSQHDSEGDYRNEQIINFEILKNTLVINK